MEAAIPGGDLRNVFCAFSVWSYEGQPSTMELEIPRAAEQSREDEKNSSYESEVPIPQDLSTISTSENNFQ
jgi:hypothetical protein